MAIIFELWAECKDQQSMSLLARHFESFEHSLPSGRSITAAVEMIEQPFGIRVSPSVSSHFGVRTLEDALETTEVGLKLYHHLKHGPDFRFARVAWEAENIPLVDLPEWVETLPNGETRFQIECVVDNALYEQLGRPTFCYPFRNGYWWTRYRGESYRPLYSNDQTSLNALCKKLFPEYFSG